MRIKKTRRQVYDLTPADIKECPVWEFALDEEGNEGQDEATVRPYRFTPPLDPNLGTFVVGASFTLADGTEASGFLTPPFQGDRTLASLHPVIVAEGGQVMFWFGVIEPSSEHRAKMYSILGKVVADVFPVRFRSSVAMLSGEVAGEIPGFLVLGDKKSRVVKVVQ